MPLGEGSVLGRRYRLLSRIGRGGMGTVWHAHDDLLDRDVAVKEVRYPPGLTESERSVLYERTLREARSAARLSHPGIVTVHDVVEAGGRPCIVMELLRARSLQDLIDEGVELSPVQVAEVGAQTLAALRAAHDAGILHRDIKPANVLLSGDGPVCPDTRVVITDFGIATMAGETALTQAGLVVGSPAYIAPERARGESAVPASDLWALGATLYAACEGRPPHDRVEAMAALAAVLTEEPPPPEHAGPLTPVLLGLLARDPAVRMAAGDAADALGRIASAGHREPAETVRDPGTRTLSLPSAGRRRRLWLFAGLAVLVGVASAAALLLVDPSVHAARPSPPPDVAPSPSHASPSHASPSPPQGPPPGSVRSAGPDGSSLFVPVGWRRRVLGDSSVRWTEPGTGAHVQVDTIPWTEADPVEHWRSFREEAVRKGTLPGFRLIRLGGRFRARGWEGADLEYSWRAVRGRLHAYDRGFTANGRQYAVLLAAPAGRWTGYLSYMDTLFGSFRPGPRA
jgi:eukaryotic-like serine/threonine-protein kinase